MKYILCLLITIWSLNLFGFTYEVEFFFTADERDTDIMKFSELITLRQFKGKGNWKDNKGDYGVVDCMGNHTIIKSNKTLLKMYCKEMNENNNNFVIMFDRNSENFNAGVGQSIYLVATGKYQQYLNLKCIYAVKSFESKGSIIKQKCRLD